MRTRVLLLPTALLVLACTACGGGGAHDGSGASSPLDLAQQKAKRADGPIREGEHIGPFVVDRVDAAGKINIPADAKLTLIDFFATWCSNSAWWLPKIEEIHRRYREQGLVVVGVAQDDEGQGIAEMAKKYGATFPIVWDKKHELQEGIHPPHWQSIVIVDKSGVVRHVHVGTQQGLEEAIDRRVKQLLEAAK